MTTYLSDTDLVRQLFRVQKKSPKLCRSTLYDVPEHPDIKVRSWKMAEHHYYTVPSPFPTMARGLFTTRITGSEDDAGEERAQYKIVARGYDKFFNMGEVPWNTWEAIAKYTVPPYTLSVKSNGCIIFISALDSSKLLITSKHAIGSVKGVTQSHSQVGEIWLEKHLKSVGRTKEQLAKALWDNSWTAVAELCDDNFEEHVLAYSPEKTGLHLHGINKNSPEFVTLPSTSDKDEPTVDSFAEEWGFIKTVTLEMDNIDDVKAFADECGKTGSWNGEPLEGFVVRTSIKQSNKSAFSARDAPPYPPGSNFFFKIKFDEPYMMYRDWREITKSYLSIYSKEGPLGMKKSKATKQRLKRPETRVYDYWVRKKIPESPELFTTYQNNRGIVQTREMFLEWLAGKEGTAMLTKERGYEKPEHPRSTSPARASVESDVEQEEAEAEELDDPKTLIVPIAIPGCGKTTVALALTKLFGFGHTQSDDVVAPGKKSKPARIFEGNVRELLQSDKYSVVIADKNNHLIQHRSALRALLPNRNPPVRLVALHWSPASTTNAEIRRICGERIRSRGVNHQTLRADPDDPSEHEKILGMFIYSTQELEAHEVDDVIEMKISDTIEESVKRAVEGLCKLLPLEPPSEEDLQEAVEYAKAYEVPRDRRRNIDGAKTSTSKATQSKKVANGPPRYFGLTVEDLDPLKMAMLVEEIISTNDGKSQTAQLETLWKAMRPKFITPSPHITIVHKNNLESNGCGDEHVLWDSCLDATEKTSPEYHFRITDIVFNDRTAAFVVDPKSLELDGDCKTNPLVDSLPSSTQDALHITIGTRDGSVKPIEARELVLLWRKGQLQGGGSLHLSDEPRLQSKLERRWS